MEIQTNPFLIWQLIPATIMFWLSMYIQSRPIKKRESNAFSMLMLAGGVWSLTNAFQYISPDLSWQSFWNTLAFAGIMIIPTAWFLVAVKYTGYFASSVEKRQWIFWIIPGLSFLLAITNPWHNLFFASIETISPNGFTVLKTEWGTAFYLHTYYSYATLGLGMLLMAYALFTNFKRYGVQAYGLIIGILTPLAGNILFVFGLLPPGFPDPTPIAFSVTGIAFAWAIFAGKMLDAVPLARDQIIKQLGAGIVILTLENRVLDINPAARRVLGVRAPRYADRPLKDLVDPNPASDTILHALEGTLPPNSDLKITLPDTDISYIVHLTDIEDRFGNTTGKLLQLIDISDVVQAEQNLSTAQETLEEVLDNLQDAYFEADPTGRLTYINQSMINALGYDSKAEVLGKHFRNFSDRSIVRDLFQKFQQLYETGNPLPPFEYLFRTKSGESRWSEASISPIIKDGQVIGTRGTIRDISQRLKAEQELKNTQSTYFAILETLQDPYFEVNTEGTLTYVNSALSKATLRDKDEIIGKHFRQIVGRESIRELYTKFGLLYETDEIIAPFRMIYRRIDGRELTSEAVISRIIENGEVVGARGIIRDITDQLEAEGILRQAKNAAEERADEMALMNRVAETVGKSLDLESILQSVCSELAEIFPVRNAGIGLLNANKDSLEIIAFHSNDPQENSAVGLVLPLDNNTTSQSVIKNKKTEVIQDAQLDPGTKSAKYIAIERGTRAIMIVPLLSRGQAIGTIGMPALDPEYTFSESEIELAETIASQIAGAIDNARLHAQTESALDIAERDLEIGRQIQSGFFPEKLPQIAGWDIVSYFEAARQVAGDFYDIFQFKDSKHLAFIIADVCDKGVGAALFMVLFRSLLRAYSEVNLTAENIERQLHHIIMSVNNFIAQTHDSSNMFATIFYGILDPDNNTLYYINGGHEPPVLLDQNSHIKQLLMPTGPAVGMFPDLPFTVSKVELDPGDFIVGFTDGVTDAKNNQGQVFTEERLLENIQRPWTSMFSMIYEVNADLINHIGEQNQFDDITLIALRRKHTQDVETHAITRTARMSCLAELRDFAEQAAIQSGMPHQDAFAFKLSTEEIVTNIIMYGFEHLPEPGDIKLTFTCNGDSAQLTIADNGKHFPPEAAATPDLEADWEERSIGGLGIYFVQQLMDTVSYTREDGEISYNKLTLQKKRSDLNE